MMIQSWLSGIAGALVIGFAAVASSSAPQWSVTPPAGWDDVTAAMSDQPSVQQQRQVVAAKGGTMEIAGYSGPNDSSLVVVFLRAPGSSDTVRGFVEGSHHSALKSGVDTSYFVHDEGNTLIVDEVVKTPTRTLHIQQLAGSNYSQMLAISGTCYGPDAICMAALHSLSIDRTGFRSLSGGGHDLASVWEASTQLGSQLAPLLVLIGLLIWLWFRRQNKKRAAGLS